MVTIHPVVVLPPPGEVEVVVVVDAVAVELAVEVEEVETTDSAEVMGMQISPKMVNITRMTTTVGPVGMILQKHMTVQHVTTKDMDIKIQQQLLIQWEVPLKIKNFPNGNEVVGSYKQIILKRKRLTQQQKE